MGNKLMHKLIAVFVAAAMILTCSIGVFAAGSPTTGKVSNVDRVGKNSCKSLTITWKADKAADKYIVKVGSKEYTATGTSLTVSVKAGSKFAVSVTPVYGNKNGETVSGQKRWMKTTKITKAKSGKKSVKLTWKKVKGATKYQVLMYKNGAWKVVKTTKKLSATIKTGKKGSFKFKVKPIKGSYYGVRSAAKTGKAK